MAERAAVFGRHRELEELDRFFEAPVPGLAHVTGAAGIGKSAVLGVARDRLVGRDWTHLPTSGALVLGPDDTIDTARRRLVPDLAFEQLERVGLEVDTHAPREPGWLGLLGRLRRGLSERDHPTGWPVVEELVRRAPVIVTIELHGPAPDVLEWLARELAGDVRRSGAAIAVVVVSEQPVSALTGQVELELPFGPVDVETVREALRDAAHDDLSASELARYAEAGSTSPRMLEDLLTLLPLTAGRTQGRRMLDAVDPGKYVDREVEQEVFAELIRLNDERRLLLIADEEGTGKSAVLRRLHHNCRAGIAPAQASLVQLAPQEVLEQGDQVLTPRDLVAKVRRDLGHLAFPEFDAANTAYLSRQWQPPGFVATFTAGEGTEISGNARAAAVYVQGDLNVHGTVDWPSPEHELQAARACVTAFLRDLRAIATQHTVALFLDSYERCDNGLRDWLQFTLIKEHCLDDGRPDRLVVVVAGHEKGVPTLNPQQQARFASRRLLGWSEEHVREFMALYDFALSEPELEFLAAQVVAGTPISEAYQLAVFMDGRARQRAAGAR